MSAIDILVFGSVAFAVIAWGFSEALRSRVLWTVAALLMLVHSAAAFLAFYDGSHAIARVQTMRQTAALTGIEFWGGIYINYLFLIIWTADVAWWWLAPSSYSRRPGWASLAVRGFIFFIIVNGAVIFADGWARVIGVVAIVVATVGVWRGAASRRQYLRPSRSPFLRPQGARHR